MFPGEYYFGKIKVKEDKVKDEKIKDEKVKEKILKEDNIKIDQIKFLLRQMLNRNYKERITINEVVEILEDIVDKKVIKYNKYQAQSEKITIFFPLLEEEKLEEDKINEKLPSFIPHTNKSLFDFYKPEKTLKFSKDDNKYQFSYNRVQKELTMKFGQAAAISYEVTYTENQLPI